MRILVVNPGGTSTKISVFEDTKELLKTNITHSQKDLEQFKSVVEQLEFRKEKIMQTLSEHNIELSTFDAVSGRGGLMKPISGGTYCVNEKMIEDLKNRINGEHASNLGALIANNISEENDIPAFVVDPVSVDEFQKLSRLSGIDDLPRASWLHSLNHKAVCRKIAEKLDMKYEDGNFIVAHLGSGNSVVAHRKGKMIDGSGGRTDGPFSPERSGGLPTYPLVKLCYSGKYSEAEMINKISNIGGMYDYLGTKDMITIEKRIQNGDEKASLVFDTFIYQVAKEISMYGASLYGEVDRIIVTGGIANSKKVVEGLKERISFLAPVEVVPGEMEMEALALGALRVLNKKEEVKKYE